MALAGVVAALGAPVLVGGCATVSPPSAQVRQVHTTARRHGLAVHVRARTSSPAASVRVVVRAEATHAPGALAYAVHFGDGTVAQNHVPTFCVAGPGPHRQATWHLSHRYDRSGTYRLSVRVSASCAAGGPVTASVRLRVG